MNHPTPARRYFAASNSCEGFCNYYTRCFSETRTQRLYIIKGGPGTGKSHFMKTVARYAKTRGYTVTEYTCSSDPASLDGVLLEKEGVPTLGFLDGTAPHTWEPTLPGVREDIINLGAFWDSTQLIGQEPTIRRLGEGKSAAYARAYAHLRAAGDMDQVADSLVAPCVHTTRLEALAARLLRRVPDGKAFSATPALRQALGMTGPACWHTFEELAAARGGAIMEIQDYYGLGYHLTAALYAYSQTHGHDLLVSYHPIYPHKVDGLYYPAEGLCILVGDAQPPEDVRATGAPGVTRSINLARYVDSQVLRDCRGQVRHTLALRDRHIEGATHHLAAAATYHFDLEKIYSSAMDFTAKEGFTTSFCQSLDL